MKLTAYERKLLFENAQLRAELGRLQIEKSYFVRLAASAATTADEAKLRLILSGALTIPRKGPNNA